MVRYWMTIEMKMPQNLHPLSLDTVHLLSLKWGGILFAVSVQNDSFGIVAPFVSPKGKLSMRCFGGQVKVEIFARQLDI